MILTFEISAIPSNMNKKVNYDLKNLNNWHNVGKPKAVLLKSLTKQTDYDLLLKLNGKRLYPMNSVKHLGIIIDNSLSWHHQINSVAAKLNRANAILSKIRRFVNFNKLKSIYHAILEYFF